MLVCVSAERLVLGVDVAAAKFLSGQQTDDHVREQEILESMAGRLSSAERRHALGMEFFRDQITAADYQHTVSRMAGTPLPVVREAVRSIARGAAEAYRSACARPTWAWSTGDRT